MQETMTELQAAAARGSTEAEVENNGMELERGIIHAKVSWSRMPQTKPLNLPSGRTACFHQSARAASTVTRLPHDPSSLLTAP